MDNPTTNKSLSMEDDQRAAVKKTAVKKAAVKKAAVKKAAVKKASKKTESPALKENEQQETSKPGSQINDILNQTIDVVDRAGRAIPDVASSASRRVRSFAARASEKTQEFRGQARQHAKVLGEQAQDKIKRGKRFASDHPAGAVASALAIATLAGLAAGKSTFKAIRKKR